MVISTEQVLTSAKFRLRLSETTIADAYLEKLINEGAMHLGALRTYSVQCKELTIDCYKAKLPDYFEQFLAAQFPSGTCSCGCGCNDDPDTLTISGGCPVWYVNRDVLTNFNGTGCSYYANFFDINAGYIVLPSTTTATHIKVWYQSLNVDDDGLMIIDSQWERGLSAYAAFQYAVVYQESYSPEQRSSWSAEWKAQKGYNIGRDNIKRFELDKHAICQLMNSILSNTSIAGVYGARSNY